MKRKNPYIVDYRNAKIDGQWEQVPYYTVKDDFPYGHGEKSVLLASRFIAGWIVVVQLVVGKILEDCLGDKK